MNERTKLRVCLVWAIVAPILFVLFVAAQCAGQSCTQTANFRVCGSSPLNQQVAQAAEIARKVWAERWFGRALPDWSAPAEIKIVADNTDGGGATHFVFDRGEAYGWSGNWQGRPDRLVATVVPHEVTHMLLASYFRRPLPRWIDEGCAMLAEPRIGRHNWRHSYHWLPFPRFLGMTEYPKNWFGGLDQAGVRSLYSEALTLSEFVVWHRGYPALPALAERYVETGSWDKAFTALLGCDVATLEPRVYSWVQARQPPPPDGKQGSHQWTANGWRAIRYDSPRTAAVGSAYKTEQARRLVPVLPVKPATGRPVVGGLSSPGRSGESLKEIQIVRDLLVNRSRRWPWESPAPIIPANPAATSTAPLWQGPVATVPAQSTATTTAPLWQSPAPTVQTAVPDQVYAELEAVRNELATVQASQATGHGVPPDVTNRLLAMESRLVKQINQSGANTRATAVQAAASSQAAIQDRVEKSQGRLQMLLGIVGSAGAAAVAFFTGGPAGLGLWGASKIAKKAGEKVIDDLKAYRDSGGKDPTYPMEWAAGTRNKVDDVLAKVGSDVAVRFITEIEDLLNSAIAWVKTRTQQPAGGTGK